MKIYKKYFFRSLVASIFLVNIHAKAEHDLPLFFHYPQLQECVAHILLGDLPTPVQKLDVLGTELGVAQLYVKRDDMSGALQQDSSRLFGGNKVRKLEFLLADALHNGTQTVITFGGVGSNHVVATATHAQQLGLKSIALLTSQPNAHGVRRNLSLMHYYNVDMLLCSDEVSRNFETLFTSVHNKQTHGDFPYIIVEGGSSPIGTLGFVNAAFELKQQIEQGLLPEPDYIYVPAGTGGTISGLMLGLRAADLKTRVVGVTVSQKQERKKLIMKLLQETNAFLHERDESFLFYDWCEEEILLNNNFCGQGYGLFTQEGVGAKNIMHKAEGIILDGTYTGKAFAALISDVSNDPTMRDSVILFWNTYCSNDFTDVVSTVDYKAMMEPLHDYFERDVQELDH